ncbi:MAG: PQQ-dependent sugar dehydrogenase [Gemmataceae bacterium]|nr:PQQ-dependent sugar dehydrogenase [Gemmataceae bacterium]MCI0738795.1 PQQ-dependent sugar dehydrogenase [Gemmataceae bacterium]
MKSALWLVTLLVVSSEARAGEPSVLASGLKNPESVAVGGDGRIYITSIGEFDKDGDGAVLVLDKGKAVTFATGLDDPKGIVAFQKWLFVADKNRVVKIDLMGKVDVLAAPSAFPTTPINLNDIAVDIEIGTLYVSDSGNKENKGGAIFRIHPKGKVSLITDQKRWPDLQRPNGLALDGQGHLLLLDSGSGKLHRVRISTGKAELVAEGFGHGDGIAWDMYGRLFLSDWKSGRVFGIARPGEKPAALAAKFESAADLCVDHARSRLLVPDMKAGMLTAIPAVVPGFEVDETPLPLHTEVAFPKLQWTGWKGETDAGKLNPLRPILLTHAGDGTNRVFVPTQHGVIHVFPNDQDAAKSKVFLDIEKLVTYRDDQNEEGFLGLAFHPKYKATGEFFVFYTIKKAPKKHTNILSRFRVSRDDPDRADPASEEILMRIERPFWNHDGGTICFGPDGFLYVTLGDGGAANDPFNNGQNLKSLLGKVLRIDVDRKDPGLNYAIPKDNPFIQDKGARPETWAYGLRNIWRMAFDKKTGKLWAGEVGQNLYEEINIIERGGNYGWKLRESYHPFSDGGVGVREDLIDPIWEYHHDVGKSITGGCVYRGKRLPELDGAYLYADYVTAKIWALWYDEGKKRVVANRTIADRRLPILSFGEDETGDVYLMTYSIWGQGIFRFARK